MTDGIDVARVTAWLVAEVDGAVAPFEFERIGGGRSNLTYAVTVGSGGRFVLRRPPLGHVLATAHDMAREHRVISALNGSGVPVPRALGLCTDDSVNGAPFYVMELVDGEVVESPAKAEEIPEPIRAEMSRNLIDVLLALHGVDIDAAGLGDLARHEGFIERQIRRWSKQWEGSKTREIPAIDSIATALAANIPAQQGVTITHGDYRFGNCITDVSTGRIAAVLDWELCTLGDPLADLGYLGVHWTDERSTDGRHNDPTSAGGFGTFDDALARYAAQSSRDLTAIDFYRAFQNWRLAVILEGVYARYLHGAMGVHDIGSEVQSMGDGIFDLVDSAQAALDRYLA